MLKLLYTHTDFRDLMGTYTEFFGVPMIEKRLEYPAKKGKGYMCFHELPNGLECIETDYANLEPIFVQRKPAAKDGYVLRFDIFETPAVNPGEQPIRRTAAQLTSTRTEWIFLLPSQTRIRSLSIHFSREWLEHWIYRDGESETIRHYLASDNTTHHLEALDNDYVVLLNNLFAEKTHPQLSKLQIFNSIMLMMERFFARLVQKIEVTHFDSKISANDRGMLKEVEQVLLKDFTIAPPGIKQLARMAAMSPSKLKASFKYVYGIPIYQYYQKHRMNKAKAMLISKKYSVKEVSRELGFEQLTNFTKAFKKAFDQNPASITGETVPAS